MPAPLDSPREKTGEARPTRTRAAPETPAPSAAQSPDPAQSRKWPRPRDHLSPHWLGAHPDSFGVLCPYACGSVLGLMPLTSEVGPTRSETGVLGGVGKGKCEYLGSTSHVPLPSCEPPSLRPPPLCSTSVHTRRMRAAPVTRTVFPGRRRFEGTRGLVFKMMGCAFPVDVSPGPSTHTRNSGPVFSETPRTRGKVYQHLTLLLTARE